MPALATDEVVPVHSDLDQLSWRERIDAVVRACRRIGASRAWVIGSAGRGTPDLVSDLDVVVEKQTQARVIDRVGEFLEAIDRRFNLDVLIYDPGELRSLLQTGQPFLTDAWPDARLIYERGQPTNDPAWLEDLERRSDELRRRKAWEDARVLESVRGFDREGSVVFDPSASAADWLGQAQADLVTARTLRQAGQHAPACFYSQQSGEKAAKAFLIRTGDRQVPEHSVGKLVARAQLRDNRFGPLLGDGAFLDRFYIPTRYPDAWPGGAVPATRYFDRDSQETIAAAERILAAVEEAVREQDGQQHP